MIDILVFLLLHFVISLFRPAAKDPSPFFYVLFNSAAIELERRLNRDTRAPSDLMLRGGMVTLVMGAAGLALGFAAKNVGEQTGFGIFINIIFLYGIVTLMAPLDVIRRAAKALIKGDNDTARAVLQPAFHDTLGAVDAYTLTRRTAELSAMSLNTWFTGPLFWFALAGLPGAFLSLVFAALREAFGGAGAEHAFFGMAVRFADRLFGFIPALLSALGIAVASVFVTRSSPGRSFGTLAEHAMKFRNWHYLPVAAMAGALGVALGGAQQGGWVGPEGSTAKVTPEKLDRCAMIHFVFFMCAMAIVGALALSTGR